ncbi:MAG: prepilin-type N-terminal cleavage/methylation domain-containing protein [Rickettsiales bacterium]
MLNSQCVIGNSRKTCIQIPPPPSASCNHTSGFTLVELSIVLVIIGLIIGSILMGRDLIDAAMIRSQISQIEKYNTAVNTFKVKYGYLPGDISDPTASGFNFKVRGAYKGEGDGDGILEGINTDATLNNCGFYSISGENALFWVDLSTANMIDGTFNTATATVPSAGFPRPTGTDIYKYFPRAKIGSNYVYTGSGACTKYSTANVFKKHVNYFIISLVSGVYGNISPTVDVGLTVRQAYQIDSKIDDGLPQLGNVLAGYFRNCPPYTGCSSFDWSNSTQAQTNSPYTTATPASSTSCFDNGNVVGTQQYSVGTNDGNEINCAISIQFQ